MINDALQGKFRAPRPMIWPASLLNSTVGVRRTAGPREPGGLGPKRRGFWTDARPSGAFHPGPFLELPFFGPRTCATAPARIVDVFTGSAALHAQSTGSSWSIYGLRLGRSRAPSLLSLDDTLKNVFDPYAFIRDAYLQRRAYLISDGKVTDEPLVDPGADDPPDTRACRTGAPPAAPHYDIAPQQLIHRISAQPMHLPRRPG